MSRSIAESRPLALPTVGGTLNNVARSLTRTALSRITVGRIVLSDAQGTATFGRPDPSAPSASIQINDDRAYGAIAFGGSVGAGDAYVDGLWESDDLVGLVRLMVANRSALEQIDGPLAGLSRTLQKVAYRFQRNTRAGSQRNISAHYDLSNELFELFLDPTMTYSCAIFDNGAKTLEEASIEKLDRVCRKLALCPEDHLLEIGTGWGSMSLHAAGVYGCRVTTTTISREQATLARRRIDAAGLSDRIEVIEQDYRDLTGTYDRVVSIEMIEAVGAEHLPEYFECCSRLLKPEGMMLLQAITIADQHFVAASKRRDWLKKYIFPGSCLTSLDAMQRAITARSDLRVWHAEEIGMHYSTTLRMWRERFNGSRDAVLALGFDERFLRLWNYYLQYCEGVFAERHTGDLQLLLAKPACRRVPVSGAELARPAAPGSPASTRA